MCFERVRVFLDLEKQVRFVVLWQTGPELRTNVSIDTGSSKLLFCSDRYLPNATLNVVDINIAALGASHLDGESQ